MVACLTLINREIRRLSERSSHSDVADDRAAGRIDQWEMGRDYLTLLLALTVAPVLRGPLRFPSSRVPPVASNVRHFTDFSHYNYPVIYQTQEFHHYWDKVGLFTHFYLLSRRYSGA